MKEYTVVVNNYDYGVRYHYIDADEHETFIDAVSRYNKIVESIHPNNTYLKINLEISDIVAVFEGHCKEAPDGWWM